MHNCFLCAKPTSEVARNCIVICIFFQYGCYGFLLALLCLRRQMECASGDQMNEGSWAEESFGPAVCNGLPMESAAMFGRPFTLVDNNLCPYSPSATLKRWQTGSYAWTRIPSDLLSVRRALTAGPVVLSVDSYSLGNGVGIAPATASNAVDHYIAIVGYYGNVTTPYFLYK